MAVGNPEPVRQPPFFSCSAEPVCGVDVGSVSRERVDNRLADFVPSIE